MPLVATGRSLADVYMAFDVDGYARLYRLTGDPHLRDVAQVLLPFTKHMIALPSHPYDFKGLGWQHEHWTFAPRRGNGSHRGWRPWVTAAHLNGIAGLEEQDPALYRELAGAGPRATSNAVKPAARRAASASRSFASSVVTSRATPDP